MRSQAFSYSRSQQASTSNKETISSLMLISSGIIACRSTLKFGNEVVRQNLLLSYLS